MNDNVFNLNEVAWVLKPSEESRNTIPKDMIIPTEGLPAKVPGDIYLDLLNAGLIDDPFYGINELSLSWVANCDWEYQTTFKLEDTSSFTQLVFDGLDTIADIYLNGSLVSRAENMFVRYTFDVEQLLIIGTNLLTISFHSAVRTPVPNMPSVRQLPSALNPDRVFIRKAQYSFGWDWGPSFPGVGIWKNVYLQKASKVRIDHIDFETESIDKNGASINLKIHYEKPLASKFKIKIRLSGHDTEVTDEFVATHTQNNIRQLQIAKPSLWWPHNIGKPNLYNLEISILDEQGQMDEHFSQKVGIRKVELRLKENGQECFKFFINGRALFLKGANWIPADSFLPRVDDKKYANLISAARDANMNVLRVWGGGIYENDIFYELCDEMGIMVWQDLMFACATYPDNDSFTDNLKNEITLNINRLSYHPSIILWCGNNEIEWMWHNDCATPVQDMQGYSLFHKHIPDWLKTIDTTRPYWPSSPWGNDDNPNDEQSGNRHAWNIWSKWIDYTEVYKDKSLFVSEFGFQAPAMYETFKTVLPEMALKPQSALFEFHNKQVEGVERLFRFLSAHLPVRTDLPSFIYLTQLNQGLALKTCLEHWRLRWPQTSGSIIWQLNDCWPVSSWSLIDSELRKKHAYFFSKHSFQNIVLGFDVQDDEANALVLNDSSADFNGNIEYYEWNFTTNKGQVISKSSFTINAESKKELNTYTNIEIANKCVIISLSDMSGMIITRNYYLSKKWKHASLPKPVFKLVKRSSDNLEITASSLLFFVKLEHADLEFSDLPEVMLPGEVFDVQLTKGDLNKTKIGNIKVNTLNDFLCEL